MNQDEFIAMKMLTRWKEIQKEQPNKPRPDIEWMLGILDVVREYDKPIEQEPEKEILYDADPNCVHDIIELWSEIKCSKCGGWYCE